jgi:hypothetical protein
LIWQNCGLTSFKFYKKLLINTLLKTNKYLNKDKCLKIIRLSILDLTMYVVNLQRISSKDQ